MARRVFIFRIRTDQHDRAKADNKGQDVEVAHKSGGVEHALTCFAGIALYPGGRQHAAEQDVHHHQHADQHYRNVIVKAKQQLDQFTCAHHLGDKVKRHHHQRTTGRKNTNRPLFQTVRGHIGKGVATEVTQTFGNQEQNDRPAYQEA